MPTAKGESLLFGGTFLKQKLSVAATDVTVYHLFNISFCKSTIVHCVECIHNISPLGLA